MDMEDRENSIIETLRFYHGDWSNDFLIDLLDFVCCSFSLRKEQMKRFFEESSYGIQDD